MSVLTLMFWCRIIRCYWYIFYGWRRYSTMNVTKMLRFSLPYELNEEEVGAFLLWWYFWSSLYFVGWWNDLCFLSQLSFVVLVTSCERQFCSGIFSGDQRSWQSINIQIYICKNRFLEKCVWHENNWLNILLTWMWATISLSIKVLF